MPITATILDTMVTVLAVFHAILGLAYAPGRGNMELSSASPRPATQPCNVWRSVYVLLPHVSRMYPLHDDVTLTCGDVPLLQDTVDKVQAHPTPKNVKRVQIFVGIWGLGRTFIPHWAQHLYLYAT